MKKDTNEIKEEKLKKQKKGLSPFLRLIIVVIVSAVAIGGVCLYNVQKENEEKSLKENFKPTVTNEKTDEMVKKITEENEKAGVGVDGAYAVSGPVGPYRDISEYVSGYYYDDKLSFEVNTYYTEARAAAYMETVFAGVDGDKNATYVMTSEGKKGTRLYEVFDSIESVTYWFQIKNIVIGISIDVSNENADKLVNDFLNKFYGVTFTVVK